MGKGSKRNAGPCLHASQRTARILPYCQAEDLFPGLPEHTFPFPKCSTFMHPYQRGEIYPSRPKTNNIPAKVIADHSCTFLNGALTQRRNENKSSQKLKFGASHKG